MVSKDREDGIRHSTASKTVENPLNLTVGQSCNTSSVSKTQFDGLRLVRTKMRKKGMSSANLNIILNSWREKTRTQYNIYLSRFATFCKSNNLNPHVRDEHVTLKFLTEMFQKGYGHSTINSARAALSSVNDTGSEPLVCRFMRGVFNLRPARLRYSSIWNVSIVLNYLLRLVPAANLSLHMLSAKLVTLLALVTGQQCQALHALDIRSLCISQRVGLCFPLNPC